MKRLLSFLLVLFCFILPLGVNAYDIDESDKLTYTNSDTTLPYRLILPENYDKNKDYPLIVFFHGAGERGNDNELQFVHCVQYIHDNTPEPCIIVAPQCPVNNQWVDTPWSLGAYSVDKVPESNEMKAVIELLGELQTKYSVDSDRIYAAGISMGGFATWDAITRHNDIFAAAIPVCGGGDPSKAELLKDTPIFTFHAINDPDVPVTGTQETVAAIKAAGGKVIQYTEYSYGGHGIWNQAFATAGLLEKLFNCKLSERGSIPGSNNTVNVALNKKYEATVHQEFTANLTDGVAASTLTYDKNWFCFFNNPKNTQPHGNAPNRIGTVVIDLDGTYDISEVKINFTQNDQSGVSIPAGVNVYLSEDGQSWGEATALNIPAASQTTTDASFLVKGAVTGKASFVKVEIALGEKSFAFLNEIEVYGNEPKKDSGNNIALNKEYQATVHKDFTANLTDGIAASTLTTDANWFVFYNNPEGEQPWGGGVNAENRIGNVIINLGGSYNISEVKINVVANEAWGVSIPAGVNVYLSEDGESWGEATALNIPASHKIATNVAFLVEGEVTGKASLVKVEIALGAKSFVFLNEIEVYGEEAIDDPENPPVDPENPPVDPENPPVDPENPPVDPENPPVDPENPPVDPENPPVDPENPPVDPEIKLGDVNGDEKIDQYDYILVKRHYFNTRTLTEDEAVRADVNNDNTVDQFDYILIARHYFGTFVIK